MPSQTKTVCTVTDDGTGNISWSNLSNASGSDNAYATVTVTNPTATFSAQLRFRNWGFTIPIGSTITGIEVTIERKSASGTLITTGAYVAVGGIEGGTIHDQSAVWSTTESTITLGGSSDLWGLTPTAAQVNASNFGWAISVNQPSAGSDTASVDHVTMTVYYSELPDFGWNTDNMTRIDDKKRTPHFQQHAANVEPPQVTVYNMPPVFQGQQINRRYRSVGA